MAAFLALVGCTDPGDKNDDTAVLPEPIVLPGDCSTLPTGNGFRVGPEDANTLRETLANAPPGAVYLLDDGTYTLTGGDAFHNLAIAPGVTVRSASGDPGAVVLEGGYATTELVTLGEGALLAEVTVSHAYGNAVGIRGASGARVYGVEIVDPGDIGVAVLPERGVYSDDAVVACVTVVRTETCGVGIDGVQAQDAHVYGARIDAPGCDQPGIRFATGSSGTIVERSRVTTSGGAGIALGENEYEEGEERVYADTACPDRPLVGHYGGAIRNVFVVGGGLRVEDACGGTVAHASIWGGDLAWAFSESLVLANNLASVSDGGGGAASGNVTPTAADFVDAASGDLHLADGSAAIDAGAVTEGVTDDIDGDARDATPDIGADER
ncbi:MAG: right-handed parallel beta-helix repeat-containing protein [Pseudomonadota bacterium]|nr:right-handed parallel beta-helix repeat-containing protein [Pseudomonadota bacterium]